MAKEDKPRPMGINKSRRCRDIIFLLIFAAYCVGMWIVAGVAVKNGDPRRLTIPTDTRGQYCGLNNKELKNDPTAYDLTNKPYIYYLNPER